MKVLALLAWALLGSAPAWASDCGASLGEELLRRNAADQAARNALVSSPASMELNDAVLRIDKDNTAFMRRILSECGWPRKSVVGSEAAKAAWRLTQHADMDPEYQVLAARQLKFAVQAKEADPWDLAVLVDRNRRLNDQLQVYGMQFFTAPDGTIVFYDIVNAAKLDSRREAIGLEPFFCWAFRISKENGSAPIRWPAGVLVRYVECAEAP